METTPVYDYDPKVSAFLIVADYMQRLLDDGFPEDLDADVEKVLRRLFKRVLRAIDEVMVV